MPATSQRRPRTGRAHRDSMIVCPMCDAWFTPRPGQTYCRRQCVEDARRDHNAPAKAEHRKRYPMSTNHVLKTDATFWDMQATGLKNFEIRYNDRGFQPGDTLELHRLSGEYEDPSKPVPAPLLRRVTYILHGGFDFGGRLLLDPSAVIMSTTPIVAPTRDAQMIAHLDKTLREVRQLARDMLDPNGKAAITATGISAIAGMITEALGEDPSRLDI